MKRSLFKHFVVSAFFACGLTADVPGVREQAEVGQISIRPTPNHAERVASVEYLPRCAGRSRPAVGLATYQAGVCSLVIFDSQALSQPIWLAAPLAGTTPDPLVGALSVVWPLGGSGIRRMDRSCVRWEVAPGVSLEALNIQTDPLDAAILYPRYQMLLALQASAWLRPVGSRLCESAVGEPALSLDVAYPAGRLDMDAMIPRLKKIFAREGVPQQWVWMAEIESALNPQAISSAGAAGLFQLMPGTARRFGLQTAPVDDRMAPEKSASAAAQYLKFLRQEFGCWSLALAAYNAGEGRVKEIMKKRKARTFDEVERYLPAETQAYVPKVMAIVALREDQLHGVRGAYWMP